MPTQDEYGQAILKAQLVTANLGNDIVLDEMSGCPCNWSQAICQYRKIEGAIFCYQIGDYNSDTAVDFYNSLLEIIGLNFMDGVNPDSNSPASGAIVINVQGGSINVEYTENDLIDSDPPNGNWYLPLINKLTGLPYPSNYTPTLITVNGSSFTGTYEAGFIPRRIYGFGSNGGPQAIEVNLNIAAI